MNPIDINLLSKTDVLTKSQTGLRRTLFLAAFSLGLVVVVGFVVILGLEQVASSQVSNLQNQRQELLTKFDGNVPKLNRLLALKDKLGGIKKVLTVSPDLSVAISAQQDLLVDGVATTRLVVSTSGQMAFDVTVSDVKSLSNYLTKLDSEQARKFFTSFEINGLTLGQNGGFSLSVQSTFDPQVLFKT